MLLFAFHFGLAQDVGDTSTEKTVKVFPNPATNLVNVLGLKNSDQAQITITDINGTPVQKHYWKISNQAVNLPISNLKKGIYLIHIRSKEQEVRTKFFKH